MNEQITYSSDTFVVVMNRSREEKKHLTKPSNQIINKS